MTDQPDLPDGVVDADLLLHQRVRTALRHIGEQDVAAAAAARDVALSYMAASHDPVPRLRHRSRWLAVAAAAVVGVVGANVLLRTPPGDSEQQWVSQPDSASFDMRSAELAAPAAATAMVAVDPETLRELISNHEATEATCSVPVGQQSYGVHLLDGVLVEVIIEPASGTVRVLDATSCDELHVVVLDD